MLYIRKSAIYLMNRLLKTAYQTVNWQNVKVLLLLSVGDELWGGGLVARKKRKHLMVV